MILINLNFRQLLDIVEMTSQILIYVILVVPNIKQFTILYQALKYGIHYFLNKNLQYRLYSFTMKNLLTVLDSTNSETDKFVCVFIWLSGYILYTWCL